jgi:hypothetical protein
MGTLARYALTIGAAAALLAGCRASQLPGVTSSSGAANSPSGVAPFVFTHDMMFRFTGKKQTFKVPSGVTRIRVIAVGASGGGSVIAHGGRVSAVIPVIPSETLAIYVGGAGTSSTGGFNGGGAGGRTCYSSSGCGYSGYGAGGASDVREGGDALTDRIVVAGGGGGRGGNGVGTNGGSGGKGGASIGGRGKKGCCGYFISGGGGTGGTQDQGGSGGKSSGHRGESGQLGNGGGGATGCGTSECGYDGGGGGGGGGGFYGGGGGGAGILDFSIGIGSGGGGGGGSSYLEPTAKDVHMCQGWKNATGNGLVVFSWD